MKTNTKNINHHQHQFYRRIFNILNDSKIRLSLICLTTVLLIFNGQVNAQVNGQYVGIAQSEIKYYAYDVFKKEYYLDYIKNVSYPIGVVLTDPITVNNNTAKEDNPFNLIISPLNQSILGKEGDVTIVSAARYLRPEWNGIYLLLQNWQLDMKGDSISGILTDTHDLQGPNYMWVWDQFVQMVFQYNIAENSFMKGIIKNDSIHLKVVCQVEGWAIYNSVVIKAGKITNGTNEPVVTSPYALYQNYPNPFSASTQISFELPRKSAVNISIYSLNGECITELLNGKMEAGKHTIPWKVENGQLPSGTYLIKMKTDDFTQVKKCHFIR